jgi:tRNA dimethylallyltransferase
MPAERSTGKAEEAAHPPTLIVAGPTASGKSLLALHLAEALGGAVINADSMQVYRELRILTARPTPEDEARAPHLLYGVRPAAEPGSAAWWRGAALDAVAQARERGLVPILCGGTGLYLQALVQGLAEIPAPSAEARAEARAILAAEGPDALHRRLTDADPETAALLRASDGQRLARAWEVWRSTGCGLAAWQAQAPSPASTSTLGRFQLILLDPPRDALREAVSLRFARMLDEGALDEVRTLLGQQLDPALPAMRAHGVPELTASLRGEISLDEAARRAILATGQYTKRQATWFRHRPPLHPSDAHTIHARYAGKEQYLKSLCRGLGKLLCRPG